MQGLFFGRPASRDKARIFIRRLSVDLNCCADIKMSGCSRAAALPINGDSMFESFIGVFSLAVLEMWAAVPLGFHLKLHPGLLILATVSGALVGVVIATFLGDSIRKLIFWRKKHKVDSGATSKWLAAKGPWAIGLLGPLLIGPLFAAGLAATLGLPKRSSISLLAIGIVVWTCLFTVLGGYGLSMFR
jgi:membrane protein YqaA with SNARE-associated domain